MTAQGKITAYGAATSGNTKVLLTDDPHGRKPTSPTANDTTTWYPAVNKTGMTEATVQCFMTTVVGGRTRYILMTTVGNTAPLEGAQTLRLAENRTVRLAPGELKTVADFRRAATTGSRWLCNNLAHPEVSGVRVVIHSGPGVLKFTGTKVDGSSIDDGGMDWPKAADVRFFGNTIKFLNPDGTVAFNWTLLAAEHEPEQTSVWDTPIAELLAAAA